jgi:hypothetical protein
MKSKSLILVLAAGGLFLYYVHQRKKKKMLDTPKTRSIITEVRKRFARINPKFASIPLVADTSSYTEDKEKIGLCVKNPQTGNYYNIDTIMHVALHELTHILDGEYETNHNHTPRFYRKFDEVLKAATKAGVYNPATRVPVDYCSI